MFYFAIFSLFILFIIINYYCYYYYHYYCVCTCWVCVDTHAMTLMGRLEDNFVKLVFPSIVTWVTKLAG